MITKEMLDKARDVACYVVGFDTITRARRVGWDAAVEFMTEHQDTQCDNPLRSEISCASLASDNDVLRAKVRDLEYRISELEAALL